MNSELFIAIIAGLGGMWGWGFSEFATKKSVDKIGTISSLVWAHVFGTIILVGLLIGRYLVNGTGVNLSMGLYEWIGLIFFGALQAIVYYFSYKGFEKGNVSILSPIFASFAGWVAVFSVLLFGEVLKANLIPALLLIFGGVILINLDFQSLKGGKFHMKGVVGLKEILISVVLATIWTLGWNKFTADTDWMLYVTFMFLFMTLAAYVIAVQNKVDLTDVKKGAWSFLWLIAIGEVVAYLAITLGYSSTSHASVVAILSGASSLPTIILARIFLKEKMTVMQTVSSLIIIAGVVFLSLN